MHTAAPLPVWRSIADIYRFIASHPRDLARIGWLPLVLLVALSLGFGTFAPKQDGDLTGWADLSPFLADWLLGSFSQGMIAVAVLVAWHRLVMREIGPGTERGRKRRIGLPGRRELFYFLQMFGLSLLFLGVFAISALFAAVLLHLAFWLLAGTDPQATVGIDKDAAYIAIGYIAIALGLFPAFYVALRLSLALPETAVSDEAGRFSGSWAATAGNGWRMAAVTVLSMVPIEIVNLSLSYAAQQAYGSAAYYPLAAMACLGMLLMMVVLGSALTKCYLALEQRADGRAGPRLAAATNG